MADGSAIEWTDATWNPVRGCTKLSPGCKHCYAGTFAERFRGVPGHPFEQGFDLKLVPGALELPLKWRTGRRIFVNSMSDVFHVDVPREYVERIFDVIRRSERHQFQILTKRADRLREFCSSITLPRNLWLGVSVENQEYTSRVADLQGVNPTIRFLSVEPLLGPIDALPLDGIDWVITGGESGGHARPMDPGWVRSIRDQCIAANVPFFFKQWGGTRKHLTGRTLDGRTWDDMPRAFVASTSASASASRE